MQVFKGFCWKHWFCLGKTNISDIFYWPGPVGLIRWDGDAGRVGCQKWINVTALRTMCMVLIPASGVHPSVVAMSFLGLLVRVPGCGWWDREVRCCSRIWLKIHLWVLDPQAAKQAQANLSLRCTAGAVNCLQVGLRWRLQIRGGSQNAIPPSTSCLIDSKRNW